MKKIGILVLALLSLLPVTAQAKIIGYFAHTDIVAYINGLPIPSYNIDGWTGIVAEDLRTYGFDVFWDADERSLWVGDAFFPYPEYTATNLQGMEPVTATYIPETNTKPIGSRAGSIYATDIRTYVANEPVSAYNIGGRTIIFIDELSRFGDVVWHEDSREIRYDYVPSWSMDLYHPDYEAETEQPVASFSLNMHRDSEGSIITTGENLDYLDYMRLYYNKKDGMCLGFSLYQRVLFQTVDLNTLLWDISTQSYDGTTLSPNADKANQRMKILINDTPVSITKVTQGKGSGHSDFYFWFPMDLKERDIVSVSVSLQ